MLGAAPGQSPHRYPAPPAYGGTEPGESGLDATAIDPARLAGVLRRFGAVLLDGLIPMPVFLPIVLFAVTVWWNAIEPTTGLLFAIGLLTVASYTALMGYMAYALVQLGQGRSPGKKLLGLRVIYIETGQPAGFWRMMLREVVGKWVSGVVLYLGYLWAIWDEQHQGWHDKIANTVVVREDAPAEVPVRADPYRGGF